MFFEAASGATNAKGLFHHEIETFLRMEEDLVNINVNSEIISSRKKTRNYIGLVRNVNVKFYAEFFYLPATGGLQGARPFSEVWEDRPFSSRSITRF